MRLSAVLWVAAVSMTQLAAAATYDPLLPPSYPLAVRSPYLSAWLPGSNASNIAVAQPQFWAGQLLNLGIMARANGNTYSLFSIPSPPNGSTPASLTNAKYTSTHTTFTLSADSLNFTLDFFSPVSPKNYLRQSLPFSYFTIAVQGADGGVQVYADFDDTWTGQNATAAASTTATFETSNGTAAYQLTVDGAAIYSENSDMGLWGTSVFGASTAGATLLTQTGPIGDVRSEFTVNGTLSNQHGGYAHGDVVAIAQSLGGGANSTATFAIGYVRSNTTINYNGSPRAGYYMSEHADTMDALEYFFSDYAAANSESQTLDSSIETAATSAGGTNYSDILALSLRQTYGSLDLTIPADDLTNTDDFMIFLKEISSDGNVNTLDVLYPTFPVWYVMSPEYIRYTLEPVMQYLETGAWTEPFAIHDIGTAYPNATGYPNNSLSEPQPVEESGNINILAYAYTKITGDMTFANKYRNYLQKFADYLVVDGLNMSSQLSTDDGAGPLPNQTNLAIKAAVGLNAFGQMFGLQNYSDVGRNYSNMLYDQGLGTDPNKTHFTVEYGNYTTYTTAFNLYPDMLLNLSTFNPQAFAMESSFYPTQRAQAGVPLDSRVDWAKTDWSCFCAAYSTLPGTKSMFIDDVYQFITENQSYNQVPFSDRWVVSTRLNEQVGEADGFLARPVVGGHFALLAMNGADSISTRKATKHRSDGSL